MSDPAVRSEGAKPCERAEACESTATLERAASPESTVFVERAVQRESTETQERAIRVESTEQGERAFPAESTERDERVAAWASVWTRTPPKPKLIRAIIHAARDRDDDVACLAGLLRSTKGEP